jgi:hypothetical protein
MNMTRNIIRRAKLTILKSPAILYLLSVVVTSHLIFLLSSSSVLAETLNDCDKQVLQADPVNGQCNEARSPLNSGDCLGLQDFCVFQQSFMKAHLIPYPKRGKIVDKDGNTVVIRGEAFAFTALFFGKSFTALFFGKSKITLEEVLRIYANPSVQWEPMDNKKSIECNRL